MDDKVVVWISPDNKIYEDYPTDTRYFLAIVEKDFIKLVEDHILLGRVTSIRNNPLKVVCQKTLGDRYIVDLDFQNIQRMAYCDLWYEKVANLVLNK